jgi:hypothetical protein
MSSTQSSQLDVETLRHIAQSIKSVGVAGNDGDLHFDARSALASLEASRAQLREAGSGANALAVETLVRPQDDMDTLTPAVTATKVMPSKPWRLIIAGASTTGSNGGPTTGLSGSGDYGRRWRRGCKRPSSRR